MGPPLCRSPFRVPLNLVLGDYDENDVLVWTNVRKRGDWWAELVYYGAQ